MARIEKSIETSATPERVWEMLFWDRIPEWFDGIKEAKYTSEDKDSVGATAHVVSETTGMRAEFDVEITDYVKNQRATWRTTAGDFTAVGLTTLDTTEVGTRLIFMIDYDLSYSLLGKVIDKLLVSREFEKGMERGLQKLKSILEK